MRLEFEVSRVSADLADTFRPADTQGVFRKESMPHSTRADINVMG